MMMTITEVETLKDALTREGASKPETIRRIAEACLGWPYVFGAWGEPCTPSNRKRRARDDHPTIKSKCPALNGRSCAACQWGIGVRQYDCRGFTRWLLQQVGLDIVNGSGQACQTVSNQYRSRHNWARQGPIKEMPDVVCCVFDLNGGHTGMHVGGGRIIHCSVNVQTGSTGERRWTNYAVPKGLYSEEEIPLTTIKPTIRKGARGDTVRALQEALNRLGFDCGTADGIFGSKTYNALVLFQTEAKLDPDGVCGPKTWAEIDKAVTVESLTETAGSENPSAQPGETYRVTIEGVTYEQYRRILDICPLAEAEKE